MAYRVLSKSTYHSFWCASLPMAAPCALFSRWTSRTLEGQKWCFETLTVAIIDSPTSRQSCHRRTRSLLVWLQHFGHQIWEEWRISGGRRGQKEGIVLYPILYHKFQHENTSKTAGTSHVPNRERPFYSRPSFQHVHDATFFKFVWIHSLPGFQLVSLPDRCWSKNGEQGEPPRWAHGLWLCPRRLLPLHPERHPARPSWARTP